jgi:hypothetical protein
LEVVLRDVVAAVLLSGAVDEVWVVDVGFVELVVLRDDTAGSATSETAVVRTAAFRAVVVVDVGAVGALTVVRLGAGTVFLIGTSSTSLAFPLPATVVVPLLFVVFACGSGSDTFKIRSISLANISSSSPTTSAFLPLVTVALDIVRVVRGVASSGFDADRVARRVGISITPSAFVYEVIQSKWRNEKKSRLSASHVYMTWYICIMCLVRVIRVNLDFNETACSINE